MRLYGSIEEVLACARKVMWTETFCDEYPLALIGGTCFVVQYLQQLYVVTAAHNVRNCNIDTLFIEMYGGCGRPIPLSCCSIPESPYGEELGEYADVAILTVAMDALSEEDLTQINTFSLDDADVVRPPALTIGNLHFRGFPAPMVRFDQDMPTTIRVQAFLPEAKYVGPSMGMWGLHELRFAEPNKIEQATGLSGSPVIHSVPMGGDRASLHLAGMLVRGSTDGIGHFIDADVILELIRASSMIAPGETLVLTMTPESPDIWRNDGGTA